MQKNVASLPTDFFEEVVMKRIYSIGIVIHLTFFVRISPLLFGTLNSNGDKQQGRNSNGTNTLLILNSLFC